MPRNKVRLENQAKQINQMFSPGKHIIEITKPCNLHNRKGSIDIVYKTSKSNSLDAGFCGSDRFSSLERRAKSVDPTSGLNGRKLQNRNSISSTNDLFSNKYIDVTKRHSLHNVFSRSEKELRRKSLFDKMEHPADFPSSLRDFRSLSVSKTKLNGNNNHSHNNNNKYSELLKTTTNDSNNNLRQSITPEKISSLDTDSYLRKPKRLSFDINIDNNNHFTTVTNNNNLINNNNRKMSTTSSSDSLDHIRSPTKKYPSYTSIFHTHATSPKKHFFDSADFEKEVRKIFF